MGIKLIAVDLDHTLLNSKRVIAPEDMAAIKAARAMGVDLTVATGRMFPAALPYCLELDIDLPVITYQGALVKTMLSHEELLHLRLDIDVAREVLRFAHARNLHLNVYNGDTLLVTEENELTERYRTVNRIPVIVEPELKYRLDFAPTKLVIIENDGAVMDKLEAELRLLYEPRYDISRSLPHLLEIGHPDATKSKALDFLANKLGIERREVMAIGDGLNDIDMLEWAGIGVAMGNSPDEVKAVADWVTSDNDHGGVARAIEKFIFR